MILLRRGGSCSPATRVAGGLRRQFGQFGLLPTPSFTIGSMRPRRRQISLTEEVPYPPRVVYAVVSDVESYREFVPFCSASDIVARESELSFDARLSLGFLAFTEEYVSHVSLKPPHAVTASATNTPSLNTW